GALGHEQPLLRSDGDDHSLWHAQPPETAGKMETTSPDPNTVSSPSRSRTFAAFTKRFTWRRTAPVSSQTPRYNEGHPRSICSRATRTVAAETVISEAPPASARSGPGTKILIEAASFMMGKAPSAVNGM